MSSESKAPSHYRPDIDGLRAIAVLAVVLFHFELPYFDGGFVGVDVFFVISGYLITSIIIREMESDRFSLRGFYERRIRRIFPALFVVIAVVVIVGAIILSPAAFRTLTESGAAAALSVSNFFFWRQDGYFGIGAAQHPLLHTWSLAVEEQYYLFFPAYLLLARKLTGWSWWKLILPVVVGSFIASFLVQWIASPEAAFYLPFGRMWEPALGGIAAVLAGSARSMPRGISEAVSIAGLVMLLAAVFTFNEDIDFPGYAALLPCGGAFLLILANVRHKTLSGRLLSTPPFVAIGLVSYSLYLWHWPVVVYARIIAAGPLPWLAILGLVSLTLFLSYLSWRFVEVPFRRGRFPQARVFATGGIVIAVSIVLAGVTAIGQGFPDRFAPEQLRLARGEQDINPLRQQCDQPSLDRVRDGDICYIGAPEGPVKVALFGDSFAEAIAPGVVAAAETAGQRVAIYHRAGCAPLVGIRTSDACRTGVRATVEAIAADPEIETVILAGRWGTMATGVRVGSVRKPVRYLADDETLEAAPDESLRAFQRSLRRTLQPLRAKRIFLVAHIPEQKVSVPSTAFARARLGLSPPTGVARSEMEARESQPGRIIDQLAAEMGFRVIDISKAMCNETHCPVVEDGKPLYFDDNHVSATQALKLAEQFARAYE